MVMEIKSASCKTQRKFSRFDGPRLAPDFSTLIRTGISPKNGTGSYTVAVSDCAWCQQARYCVNEWCCTSCVWCQQKVASAFLDFGEEVYFEIVRDSDGLPCAELTQPHYCAPMAEADEILARDSE